MRTLVLITGVLLLLPLSLAAQEIPKAELFTGYSLLRMEGTNLQGFNISMAANINRNLAIVADFSGNYGTSDERVFGLASNVDFTAHSFTVGPRVGERIDDRWKMFAHALFGVTRLSFDADLTGPFTTQSFSDDSVAFAGFFGGGLDMKLTDSAALRLFQADYFVFRGSENIGTGLKSEGARLSFGLVLNLGRKSL